MVHTLNSVEKSKCFSFIKSSSTQVYSKYDQIRLLGNTNISVVYKL